MLHFTRRFGSCVVRRSAYPDLKISAGSVAQKKLTITDINNLYKANTPIAVITAHDYLTGKYADEAEADMVLVGDSLAMVSLGYDDTNEIPFDEFLYHCKSVSRGVKRSFLIADLTFGSYESSTEKAIESSIALIKKGRANAVKLEGGEEICSTIKKLSSLGIPVMGHIGLTPQRFNSLGGFKVQGKTLPDSIKILNDAKAIEKAGAFSLLLEAIPSKISQLITNELSIPTIGIGAGNGTSGQVLVQADLLGMNNSRIPKFVKQYGNIYEECVKGNRNYINEVKSSQFPGTDNGYEYKVKDDVVEGLKNYLNKD